MTDTAYHYWTFNLSPFIFEVRNIDFHWATTLWGIALLVLVFGAGFIFRFSRAFAFYALIIFLTLFALQKWNINWGLRWYSTMYLMGFLATYYGCLMWIKKKTLMLTENMLITLITFGIIGMIIGARTAYVFIYNWPYYKLHPSEIIATWEGGLSFHGGIVGVCLAFILFCRKFKIPFLHLMDKIVRLVPIGIGLGRIGNFTNGELWGRPIESNVPWAIIFPDGGAMPRHPSQLYQSLGEGWGLFLTLFLLSRWKHREGAMFAYAIMFYMLYRFIVEYFRAADVQVSYFFLNNFSWGPLNSNLSAKWWQIVTMWQILCFCFFLVACVGLFLTRKNILEASPLWVKRNNFFFSQHRE